MRTKQLTYQILQSQGRDIPPNPQDKTRQRDPPTERVRPGHRLRGTKHRYSREHPEARTDPLARRPGPGTNPATDHQDGGGRPAEGSGGAPTDGGAAALLRAGQEEQADSGSEG